MRPYPKKIKRLLRGYMIEAYERELHRELTKLDQSFTEWRNGAISGGGIGLNAQILCISTVIK